MDSRIRCPNPTCSEPYDVQKVSEIIRAGSITGYSSFGYGSYTSATSALVRQLEAQRPSAPEAPKPPQSVSGCVMGIAVIAFIIAIVGSFIAATIPGVMGAGDKVHLIITGSIFGGAILVLLPLGRSLIKADRSRYQTDLRKYKNGTESYDKALRRWEASYYSPRCGSIFVPGDPRFVSIERMADLLYTAG